jgi:prepilin-type N-terminal cleavage/methylation domain-containing protein
MRASNQTQRGFTLLEIMVSIALVTVVLTILLEGFRLTENARRRGEEKLDAMAGRLAEIEALQAQMNSAVPRMLTKIGDDDQPLKLLSFWGTPKQARFLTSFSWAGERNSGQWLASYQVDVGPDGMEQLEVSEVGTPGDQKLLAALLAPATPTAHTMLLGDPADRIELSYLEPSTPGRPAAWVPEWKAEERKQLPRGVEVFWWVGKQEQVMTFTIPSLEEAK